MRAPLAVVCLLSSLVTATAQSPPSSDVDVYRALLADASCSGLGRRVGRDALVIDRNTESLLNPWWIGGRRGDMHVQIQEWFPQAGPEDIKAFVEANSVARELSNSLSPRLAPLSLTNRPWRRSSARAFFGIGTNSTGVIQEQRVTFASGA